MQVCVCLCESAEGKQEAAVVSAPVGPTELQKPNKDRGDEE